MESDEFPIVKSGFSKIWKVTRHTVTADENISAPPILQLFIEQASLVAQQ